MEKTQNNKLPMIMLPIGMVVAGLVSSLSSTLMSILIPIISQELWFSVDPIVYSVANNIGSLIGSIGYVVVLILFSLSCKGLQKKLYFVMSAYVASAANVLMYVCSLFASLLLNILPRMESSIQTMVLGLGSSVGSIISLVIEIIVAIFFFKYLSSFTEKESDEEGETYKVKLLMPSIVVVGYGVLALIARLVSSAITTAVIGNIQKEAYAQIAISQAKNLVVYIILWAALIGATFLFKDKYQKLTIVGSVIAGNSFWGFVGITLNFITIFLPNISGVVSFFSTGITTVLGIATGILIFYIANKKQYERIK